MELEINKLLESSKQNEYHCHMLADGFYDTEGNNVFDARNNYLDLLRIDDPNHILNKIREKVLQEEILNLNDSYELKVIRKIFLSKYLEKPLISSSGIFSENLEELISSMYDGFKLYDRFELENTEDYSIKEEKVKKFLTIIFLKIIITFKPILIMVEELVLLVNIVSITSLKK